MPATPVCTLQVDEVAGLTGLEGLRPEWQQLWEHLGETTPFQSPAWLIPWWRNLGTGRLWTIAVRARHRDAVSGRLVGLAPLYIYTAHGSTIRQVFLVGIGTTDYLDGLFSPGYGLQSAQAVFNHLDEHHGRWDVCDLQQLPHYSPLLHAGVPAGWGEETGPGDVCPVKSWPQGVTDLRDCVPGSFHKMLRQQLRRACALGLQVVTLDSHNMGEMLDAWFRLHEARWACRGEYGVLADSAVRRMHEQSLPELLEAGVARMWGLRLNRRLIAVLYGLMDHARVRVRRFYYYLGGFDPQYRQLSPGKLMISHAMEEAIREGAQEFDFLRGREAYKYAWGAQDRSTFRRRLTHSP